MFNKNVARTDLFLDMSQTAQNLYFHLGIDADDDGFVSPKMVMRMLGSTTDDLPILIAKGFVIPFEDADGARPAWRSTELVSRWRAGAAGESSQWGEVRGGAGGLA
jgi:hypothetical protein